MKGEGVTIKKQPSEDLCGGGTIPYVDCGGGYVDPYGGQNDVELYTHFVPVSIS